jgi:hypothetical protein
VDGRIFQDSVIIIKVEGIFEVVGVRCRNCQDDQKQCQVLLGMLAVGNFIG